MTWTEIVLTSRLQRFLAVTLLCTKALRCFCPSSSCFPKVAHTCYLLLRVCYVTCYLLATCSATYLLRYLLLPDRPRVSSAALRIGKLLPALLIPPTHEPCTIGTSGGRVSPYRRKHAHVPPCGVGDTRAF